MLISLIVPCYNEEESLPILYEALCDVREQVKDKEFEFIFINDGSRDKTWSLIEEYGRSMSISPVSSWRTTAVIRMRCCAGF